MQSVVLKHFVNTFNHILTTCDLYAPGGRFKLFKDHCFVVRFITVC